MKRTAFIAMNLTNQEPEAITAGTVERFGFEARQYAFDTVEGKYVGRIRKVNQSRQLDLGDQNTGSLIHRD